MAHLATAMASPATCASGSGTNTSPRGLPHGAGGAVRAARVGMVLGAEPLMAPALTVAPVTYLG